VRSVFLQPHIYAITYMQYHIFTRTNYLLHTPSPPADPTLPVQGVGVMVHSARELLLISDMHRSQPHSTHVHSRRSFSTPPSPRQPACDAFPDTAFRWSRSEGQIVRSSIEDAKGSIISSAGKRCNVDVTYSFSDAQVS